MAIKYVKIDAENIAVIENIERRKVLNLNVLEAEKKLLVEETNKRVAVIDEALAKIRE